MPWVKFGSKNLHCKHFGDFECCKIKHFVFLWHFQHWKKNAALLPVLSLLPAPPLLQLLWHEMKLDVPVTACTSQAQKDTHWGRCWQDGYSWQAPWHFWLPFTEEGGQWNALCYRRGFGHQLWVHSGSPPFPCHEIQQSILLLRIYRKTWACLHVKSYYLCYAFALGRWGAVGTSHQTEVGNDIFCVVFAELWIDGKVYGNAGREETKMKQMESKRKTKIQSWP